MRRGFTLVEMLVALVVGSTLLLTVAGVMLKMGGLQRRAAALSVRTAVMRQQIENYASRPYSTLPAPQTLTIPSVQVGPQTVTLRGIITDLAAGANAPARRQIMIIGGVAGQTTEDTLVVERVNLQETVR